VSHAFASLRARRHGGGRGRAASSAFRLV